MRAAHRLFTFPLVNSSLRIAARLVSKHSSGCFCYFNFFAEIEVSNEKIGRRFLPRGGTMESERVINPFGGTRAWITTPADDESAGNQ